MMRNPKVIENNRPSLPVVLSCIQSLTVRQKDTVLEMLTSKLLIDYPDMPVPVYDPIGDVYVFLVAASSDGEEDTRECLSASGFREALS